MKQFNLRAGIVALCLTILFSACAKDHAAPSPIPGGPSDTTTNTGGTAAGVGTVTGASISKTIGSDGGSLTSDDGSLTVYVPAGATSQSQTITLRRITNTGPNGLGDAYRIKPATTLQKPFKICWSYKKDVLRGVKPAAVAVAYQDGKGIWHGSKQTNVDEQDSTICADMQNGQTQDVSFICETIILPQIAGKKWILTSEPVFIDITRVAIRGSWESLPTATLVKDDILQLSLNGGDPNDGSLNNGTISEAAYGSPHSLLYVGPEHTPEPNPVIVRAKVQSTMGAVTVETPIPVDQDLLMNSTVGGLTNPMSIFTAAEGGNLSISMWSDTENSPNVTGVTVTGFTKDHLTYTSGATCEFTLAGGGKTYSSVYYPLDEHGVPVKTYGTGTLKIQSITALADHPNIGIIMGTFEAEVFRPLGGNQYERGTVSTHFQMVGGYIP